MPMPSGPSPFLGAFFDQSDAITFARDLAYGTSCLLVKESFLLASVSADSFAEELMATT
jgi:hypothetical protein